MKRAFLLRVVPTVLISNILAVVAARAADEPVAPGIIELPKFVVTDSRELPQPEQWRYAIMPGFEILTNASDKATQRLMRDFDMFRQALSHVWPLPNRGPQTAYLIICGRGGKFDAFIPKGKIAGPDTALASLFVKKGERSAIVVDLQSTTLNILNVDGIDDAATGTDSGMISVEHDKLLYREYVRYLLSRSEPRMPAWLEEGLAQIIMKMRFDKRTIEFAKLEEANTVSAQAGMIAELNAASAAAAEDGDATTLAGAPAEDRDFPAALRRRRLVPLEKFFAIKHDSSEATNILGNNVWAKQAYAFVHMCLYGENGKYQKQFTTFIARAAREPVTEAMFKECFRMPARGGTFKEMSYSDMLMAIRGYCEFTVYEAKEFRAKQDVILPPPPLALREATQAEIGRIKGEALQIGGHEAAGRNEMVAAYVRGERDPNLLAALGLAERAAGQDERARKFLEAAVDKKVIRSEAYLELARFRYADATAKPAGPGGRFSTQQVTGITDLLNTGRRQPPFMPAVYELMADTLLRSPEPAKREDVAALVDGVRLYPGRLKLAYQAAALSADAGLVEVAHSLTDHGLRLAPDATVKGRFEQLKKSLPPEPPKPPEASPAPAPAADATKKK